MIRVLPFKAYIPNPENANSVVTLGSGKISEDVLRTKANNIPYNYIHVVKPQFGDNQIEQGTDAFYQASVKNYQFLISEGHLLPQENAFYYYQQIHHSGVILAGWIVGVDAQNYLDGSVKKHENTLTGKENRLIEHIGALNSMAEPVLLSQKLPTSLNLLSNHIVTTKPIVDVTDEYQNIHKLWMITNKDEMDKVQIVFNGLDSLYIADGHHRVASASKYLLSSHSEHKGFMALVMDENDLLIKPFYRLLKDIDTNAIIPFLEKYQFKFKSIDIQNRIQLNQGEVLCLTEKNQIVIDLGKAEENLDAQLKLDVSRIENSVFKPLFDIQNTSTDPRISFLRGDNEISLVMNQIKENKFNAAFLFAPNTMQEIKEVADSGLIMPPKSTFIEPKLLTGMLIEDYSR